MRPRLKAPPNPIRSKDLRRIAIDGRPFVNFPISANLKSEAKKWISSSEKVTAGMPLYLSGGRIGASLELDERISAKDRGGFAAAPGGAAIEEEDSEREFRAPIYCRLLSLLNLMNQIISSSNNYVLTFLT